MTRDLPFIIALAIGITVFARAFEEWVLYIVPLTLVALFREWWRQHKRRLARTVYVKDVPGR